MPAGQWDALKTGDQLSIRGGVDLVAGDEVVTVKSITKVDGPTRVYNLEVASLDGQITHNYFVGEDEVWTHNVKRRNPKSGKGKFGACQNIVDIDPLTGKVQICGGDTRSSECREFCRDCLGKNPDLRDLSANTK